MSYAVYFLKKKNLTIDTIHEFLESERLPSEDGFISFYERVEIANKLKATGIHFEEFKKNETLELTAATFQIRFYSNMIALSLPFWEENSGNKVRQQIDLIAQELTTRGYIAFDPQMEKFIDDTQQINEDFNQSKRIVDYRMREIQKSGFWKRFKTWLGINLD